MHGVKVQKRIEISGSDRPEVEARLDSLRRALRARDGVIVDVCWTPGEGETVAASVLYEVSLVRGSSSAALAP